MSIPSPQATHDADEWRHIPNCSSSGYFIDPTDERTQRFVWWYMIHNGQMPAARWYRFSWFRPHRWLFIHADLRIKVRLVCQCVKSLIYSAFSSIPIRPQCFCDRALSVRRVFEVLDLLSVPNEGNSREKWISFIRSRGPLRHLSWPNSWLIFSI